MAGSRNKGAAGGNSKRGVQHPTMVELKKKCGGDQALLHMAGTGSR